MIGALRRLQGAQAPQPLPNELAAFGISGGGLKELFSTHPPLNVRIQALESSR